MSPIHKRQTIINLKTVFILFNCNANLLSLLKLDGDKSHYIKKSSILS